MIVRRGLQECGMERPRETKHQFILVAVKYLQAEVKLNQAVIQRLISRIYISVIVRRILTDPMLDE